jgi:GAF domain-containing protein
MSGDARLWDRMAEYPTHTDRAGAPENDRAGAAIPAHAAAELQELLLGSADFEEFLQYLAGYAVETIGPDLLCGVTIYRDGRPFTVASSDPVAVQIDEAQYGCGDGPCLHSMRTGQEIILADLAAERRWPEFRSAAAQAEVRSSLSLPLRADGGVEGALNLYASSSHAFGPGERGHARHLAREASRVLTLALRLARHAEFTEQLQAALASRATIDQALGVIMAQNRCDADHAFAILRAASQNRNLKLHAVAVEIITAVSGKPPRAGPRLSPPGPA